MDRPLAFHAASPLHTTLSNIYVKDPSGLLGIFEFEKEKYLTVEQAASSRLIRRNVGFATRFAWRANPLLICPCVALNIPSKFGISRHCTKYHVPNLSLTECQCVLGRIRQPNRCTDCGTALSAVRLGDLGVSHGRWNGQRVDHGHRRRRS